MFTSMQNIKKIFYLILFLIYLFIYILISMRIGVFIGEKNNFILEILYYMVFGILWIIPILLIKKKNI
ncbi:MAG: hypothetical protein CML83_04940 [Rhodobiaceae bacterium]|uniref:DUF2842 domain-containing protein n=1 Tax=PS1 clade bacterium TaxID=2175152 RepID=A0A368DML4_9PROT|nr:hypothetical protein [Rhodobiaceae bacterium]OUT74375.1 MAG: hypothetical protein CBB85_04765 [Rhizobiales bacterium TMED25]RCL73079.1 MAG: DUF2842 domain-containing protein [PS1 clade bacterium]